MEASRTEISILKELAWGVQPSPAAYQGILFTGESLKINRTTVVSDSIRPDRNVPDLIQVGGDAGGGLDCEFGADMYDELIEGALFNSWSGSPANNIVNGTTPISFHIQKKQTGHGNTAYELYKGMLVNSWDLTFNGQEKVTSSFSFLGKDGEVKEVETGTVEEADEIEMFDASNALVITELLISPIPGLATFSMNLNNNLTGRPQAGAADLRRITADRCNVSGTMGVYFENKALMDLFLNNTDAGISFVLGITAGKKYHISIPRLKLTDADHFSTGNGEEVMFNCSWQAIYDSDLEGVIEIDRNQS